MGSTGQASLTFAKLPQHGGSLPNCMIAAHPLGVGAMPFPFKRSAAVGDINSTTFGEMPMATIPGGGLEASVAVDVAMA